jgi:anti-sigma regulatory factor (Ser/Thr protein kinase)
MPRVLSHFGDELIRNEIIALTELVKNSYDANAEECKIIFYFQKKAPFDYKPLKIIIEDNGDGMTKKDIINYWLTVGTDHKKQKLSAREQPKRIPLGEKGIGRFGVHKLGEKITVITKTLNTKPISFTIDWTKLGDAQSFDEFGVVIESKNVQFNRDKGLKYMIEVIKGDWTRKKLREIYRALTALNIKFSEDDCRLKNNAKVKKLIKFADKNNTSDQFIVQVKSMYNDTVFENLKNFNEIKQSACYECDMLLSGSQIADFQYNFHTIGNIQEKFDSREVNASALRPEERLLQRKADLPISNKSGKPKGLFDRFQVIDLPQKRIGDIYVKLFTFEKTPSVKREAGIGREVDEYLRENGGIRVYRDGIRVYDYGEKGIDWLDLSSTADIGNKLRNEHVVGYVFIDRENSKGLVEKTNREGFIENNSYFLFSDALKWAIKYTFLNYRNTDKARLSEYYSKSSEPVISLLKATQKYIENNIDHEKHKNTLKKYIYKIEKEYKSIVDTLYQSAGLGILSASIVHEIEKLIKEINLQINASEFTKTKILIRRLDATIQKFSFLVKKSDIKKHSLKYIYEQAFLFTGLRLKNHSIDICIDGDINIECTASINHATNVLLNILDNSIYWLNTARENKKTIKIFATDNFLEGYATIIVSDNGPGFSNDPEYLVKPFVSTKPYSIGSGLGLYIADELMRGMKGSLSFPDFDDVSEYFDDVTLRSGAIVALNFKKIK